MKMLFPKKSEGAFSFQRGGKFYEAKVTKENRNDLSGDGRRTRVYTPPTEANRNNKSAGVSAQNGG
jgi:hypothetical protein